MHKQIQTKVNRTRNQIKKSWKGGKQKKRFESWLEKNDIWEFKIYNHEFCNLSLISRVAELEKQALDLNGVVLQKTFEMKKLQVHCNKLSRNILGKYRKSHVNRFKPYSRAQAFRHKKQLKEDCITALGFLDLQGLEVSSIALRNAHSKKDELICLVNEPTPPVSGFSNAVDKVNVLLYIKDKFCISDKAYRALCTASNLPSINQIKQKKAQIKQLTVKPTPTPSQAIGFQRDFEHVLKEKVGVLYRDGKIKKNDEVKVKLSGDGTWVGKNLHVVNVTFTILNEECAMSNSGNYLIAIFEDKEGYDALESHLLDIRHAVSNNTEIIVGDCLFKVSYYLGGDYKFLLCILGIDCASCKYSCIYCKCPSNLYFMSNQTYTMPDQSCKDRSVDEIQRCASLPKNSKLKFNCSRPPLFPTIPISHVVIDNLHLFLRITDTLMNLLILEARRLDAIEKEKLKEFNRDKFTHCARLENSLADAGISGFHFYIGRESKSLKWPTLSGPQKHKLYPNINISHILEEMQDAKAQKVQYLWDEFYVLVCKLSSKEGQFSTSEVQTYREKVNKWFTTFCEVYQKQHVTPYIHVFVAHVPDLLARFGSISQFTQQGLEKLNDMTTKSYFRSTNHRKVYALAQLMHKQNRVEFLENLNTPNLIKHNKLRCSTCREHGHNARTCSHQLHEQVNATQCNKISEF